MAVITTGDVRYHVEVSGTGPSLLLLHGFTGSAATWQPYQAAFGDMRTIAPESLGHGRSDAPSDPARYRMERCIEDLTAILDSFGERRINVLGYSMGGRIALALALSHPERVAALILESASPGLASDAERRTRQAADEALADFIEREGMDRFVARWESQPLFASQQRLAEAVRARLRTQRLAGNPLGLAGSLRGLGTGAQPSFWDQLSTLAPPTMVICGALDEKFVAIGAKMAAANPRIRLESVPDAGHAVHLEQPAAFARLVLEFIAAHTRYD